MSTEAALLHLMALNRSTHTLTPGRISFEELSELSVDATQLVEELIEAGLWHLEDDGYLLRDLLRLSLLVENEFQRQQGALLCAIADRHSPAEDGDYCVLCLIAL